MADIDEQRIDLDRAARLCGDQRGAAAEERLVDRLAGARIVLDRPPHAFDRLLGRMLGRSVLPAGWDFPERGLLAVAGLVALLADGVPARFIAPVVIPLAHDQPLLGPDDLGPDGEAALEKTLGDIVDRRAPCQT
jgi:hypothetical protein